MSLLQELTLKLADCQYHGHTFSCLPIKGEQEVLRVEVSQLEELPIFVTVTESQILCISYLFSKQEIYEDKEAELNRYLLELNVPMPLSAFATVGLSLGITPYLTAVGKLTLVILMFIGRVGPLTLALALGQKNKNIGNVEYPEGRIMIG